MRLSTRLLILILAAGMLLAACSRPAKLLTPLETLKLYADAYKKKDITQMKLLLSADTIKMHEQEAKAQNVTVDDIVKRETLFSENQKSVDFRNQKVEDEKASIEMKNAAGLWDRVDFVKEEGVWKIDRKGFATNIQNEVEQKQNELDKLINDSRQN